MRAVWIWASVLATLLGGVCCLPLGGVEDPLYKGKPYSEWLWGNSPERGAALEAIGTNAVPFLMRELRARDSFLKQKLIERTPARVAAWFELRSARQRGARAFCGFVRVAREAECAVPDLREMLREPDLRPRAIAALGYMDGAALGAVPDLARCLAEPDFTVRNAARKALRRIDPGRKRQWDLR